MLKLVIGDKNLSSWSLRPWLLLRHLGLPFEEIRLPLDTPRFHDEILRYSRARRVPVLLDGDLRVWDSLAICEYLDEKTGGRAWPGDAAARANARSVSAEMHSGFAALRTAWSMRAAVRGLDVPPGPAAVADIARIDEIWSECRARHASGGPWLFGRYGIADAMYAPVVLRFDTYGARLSDAARDYFATVLADPHLREWVRGAEREVAAEGRPLAHP
ncbi:MAG: glutathione S-transferase family protein [Steroidobacteraceae bacterium]